MLSDEDRKRLRAALERELLETRLQITSDRVVEADEHGLHNSASEVFDAGEESVEAELDATEGTLNGMHMQRALDLEAALRRLNEGRFGVCTACDEEIELARLQAYPECMRCLACQRALERRETRKLRSSP